MMLNEGLLVGIIHEKSKRILPIRFSKHRPKTNADMELTRADIIEYFDEAKKRYKEIKSLLKPCL
jgi:hypothetical protein